MHLLTPSIRRPFGVWGGATLWGENNIIFGTTYIPGRSFFFFLQYLCMVKWLYIVDLDARTKDRQVAQVGQAGSQAGGTIGGGGLLGL